MAHKSNTGLSKLIRALQNAVIKAQELVRMQHLDTVQQYIDKDGNVEVVKMMVPVPATNGGAEGYREISVPKLALMPPSSIKLDKLKMKFDVELSGLDHSEDCDDDCGHEMNINMNRGMFSRSTKATCEITFKADEAPEGLLKINDELMKFL